MKQIKEIRTPRIGDVYLVRFEGTGSEQSGVRPGVVFQNNIGNKYSPNVIVLPMTSAIKKTAQLTHVFIPKEAGLRKDSIVLCENPETISKQKLGVFLTTLPDSYMEQIAVANLLASSAMSFISQELLINTWQKAQKLNVAA